MSGRAVVERYAEAVAANDSAVTRECLHPDYVGRYPQSGEVIRGVENRIAIGENYPGQEQAPLSTSVAEIRGRDDQFITTPSWSIVHLIGSGDEFTLSGTINYPNGETWHGVLLITVRDGKIWRETDYFAPPFEAASWRAPFVEQEKAGVSAE
jgi:ketosteroid isomerase-like protein